MKISETSWHGYRWNCAQNKSKGCLAHYKQAVFCMNTDPKTSFYCFQKARCKASSVASCPVYIGYGSHSTCGISFRRKCTPILHRRSFYKCYTQSVLPLCGIYSHAICCGFYLQLFSLLLAWIQILFGAKIGIFIHIAGMISSFIQTQRPLRVKEYLVVIIRGDAYRITFLEETALCHV